MVPKQRTPTEKAVIAGLIACAYLFVLFFLSHFFWLSNTSVVGNVQTNFQAAQEHMLQHPFELSPFPASQVASAGFVIALLGLAVWANEGKKRRMMPGKEEGSAQWNKDIAKYNKVYSDPPGKTTNNGPNNMILTNEVFLNMDGRKTMRNNNILVIGGSGAGKSRFFVKPNLLQKNCSYIITDPSGELLETTGGFLERSGYKVKIFNLVEMQFSDHYNPFHYIRDDNGVLMMINCLIQNTTPPGASKGDPFWEKSETALLLAICFYLHYEIRREDRNFANVMKLLLKAQVREDQEDFKSVLDIMFEELEKKSPQHIAVRYYKIFKMGAGKTLKSILISATVRLGTFNLRAVQELTNTDTIDLMTVGDEPTALYVVIPSADTTFNYLVSMMYSQLFESLYYHAENECKGKRLKLEVRFLLDEFANIGTVPDFEKKLATMRKYGISCSIILQNLAQLKTMYKDAWESITGNCDTFLFLGGQEQTTLEYVSKKLGKVTILANGYTRSRGGQGSRSESENVKGRDLLSPDEIARMDNKNCILFIRGLLPFFCRKYNYTHHKNYKYTGDADDKLIYDYRHPERFTPAAQKPKTKLGARSFAARRTRHDIFANAKDAGFAISPETISQRRKAIAAAHTPKEMTPENLAESVGVEVAETPEATIEKIVEKLEVVGGFIADYEFQGADAFESDFFKDEDIGVEEEKAEENEALETTIVEDTAEMADETIADPDVDVPDFETVNVDVDTELDFSDDADVVFSD